MERKEMYAASDRTHWDGDGMVTGLSYQGGILSGMPSTWFRMDMYRGGLEAPLN